MVIMEAHINIIAG